MSIRFSIRQITDRLSHEKIQMLDEKKVYNGWISKFITLNDIVTILIRDMEFTNKCSNLTCCSVLILR